MMPENKHKLFISILCDKRYNIYTSIKMNSIATKVNETLNTEGDHLISVPYLKEIVYQIQNVTSTIEKLVQRPLSWAHYYGCGDEVVGIISLNFNSKELEQIYNHYIDTCEETIVFDNDKFLIAMWEQDDENNMSHICLNVRMVDDNTNNTKIVRENVISLFPTKHIDTPYSDEYVTSLEALVNNVDI